MNIYFNCSIVNCKARLVPGGLHSDLTVIFPCGSDSIESACNVGDLGSIPRLGRSLGVGHGYPLQYLCLENPHGQRRLAGYSPWGHKESDVTEWLSTQHIHYEMIISINLITICSHVRFYINNTMTKNTYSLCYKLYPRFIYLLLCIQTLCLDTTFIYLAPQCLFFWQPPCVLCMCESDSNLLCFFDFFKKPHICEVIWHSFSLNDFFHKW